MSSGIAIVNTKIFKLSLVLYTHCYSQSIEVSCRIQEVKKHDFTYQRITFISFQQPSDERFLN